MRLAREGIWEMVAATVVFGALAAGAIGLYWPLAIVPVLLWGWVIAFFRDPHRERSFDTGQFCAAADGTVTEIARLAHDDAIGGPAVRIGVFLSIFDVHANRSPCSGRVRSVEYRKGRFLDARDPRSSRENESNTLVIDPAPPLAGPIIVRQIAGKLARRIVCDAKPGDVLRIGQRFGMIKFGSRTEVILPAGTFTDIEVRVGQKVRAGLTLIATQRPGPTKGETSARHREVEQPA